MENIHSYISISFVLITICTVGILYNAAGNSKPTLIILFTWLGLQAAIGVSGFYTKTETIPPRFLILVLPPLVCILGLFITSRGRLYLDSLNIEKLTLLHIIRIPVEMVLYDLYLSKAIPELMTFEGRNFDILSGITAIIVFYFGFVKNYLSNKIILVWNYIGIGLLLNIVSIAILSAPFPFQQFGFDQPNIAVLHFPFNWLPCCVVPLVLLSHLAAIRQLLNRGKYYK